MKTTPMMLTGLALALASCDPEPDTTMNTQPPATSSGRVQVTRIGVIEDDLAYNQRRGIYVVRDTETGKEYIGLSGVGIVERASHSSGKTANPDER